uniref:Uncharacterized protein n=1 Tax=Fagus sylvatica TaxID=28930 RepID=A0A2N9FBS8_FAGSY
MIGNPALRDGKLYGTYHRDKGHMTENCHLLKVHLEKLVSAGYLNQYVDADLSEKKEPNQNVRQPLSTGLPSAGVIHVIHNPLCSAVSSGSYRSQMQKTAHLRRSFSIVDSTHPAPVYTVNGGGLKQVVSFSDSDLKDVQLPHNDPLVVTLRIGNYDAIPSTLHQKLRFPTKDGVMELNGDQVTAKHSKLSAVDRELLLQILIGNWDIFAWSVYDAPGVSPDLACHSLNIGPEHRPIVQKRRKLAPERATIVLEETERLLASGVIREVQYLIWLSNTVLVKKKNGKWKVCIDFTDLNKACPKDPFPLPRIDQLVDSALGHARLSFLDAFQGYHQIPMNAADQEKTAFITPRGTYCYKESRLRLNASNCTFGVSLGKFLGHVVSRRGIEANSDEITALVNLAKPRNIKQVQRLTGMVAALDRFISRSTDKCKPFFCLLGKRSKFVWDEECSVAFQGIKTYLSTPPCLSILNPRELLFLYLAVSDHAVALALLQAAKKLPHYFQSSTVTILSDLSLKCSYRDPISREGSLGGGYIWDHSA